MLRPARSLALGVFAASLLALAGCEKKAPTPTTSTPDATAPMTPTMPASAASR